MKRKGYSSIEKQMEADKRYLASNPEAKENRKVIVARSQAKKFIREYATLEELRELLSLIREKIKEE